MTEWEKEQEAFLIKIGQAKPATSKPVTKKEEE
jgi:hypothetical protein